jgi:pyruvate/2-oxoglutarate dehydrogenase complex dihydrolipoamide acyltransferase (E2) component
MIDIKVPAVGESISEVTLLKWTKKEGDWVERDEVIAELESEKATFEVNAEKAGVLKPMANEGDTIAIGAVLAQIDETAAKPEGKAEEPKAPAQNRRRQSRNRRHQLHSHKPARPPLRLFPTISKQHPLRQRS